MFTPPFPTAAGYLPSFWIKLRLVAAPAANSAGVAALIPALLGGPAALTVGMVATFIAVSCIIAADTGAYFCGKAFGRTQVGGGGRGAGCKGSLRAVCLCRRRLGVAAAPPACLGPSTAARGSLPLVLFVPTCRATPWLPVAAPRRLSLAPCPPPPHLLLPRS